MFRSPFYYRGTSTGPTGSPANGLPLIITPNTGGEDLIEDEKTGLSFLFGPRKNCRKIEGMPKIKKLPEISDTVAKKPANTLEIYAD